MPSRKVQKTPKTIPLITTQDEEKLTMIMKQIERGSFENMDATQITEVLSQKRQVNEYIHEENMQEHERFKILQRNAIVQWGVIVVFALIIFLVVAVVDKSYMPQALTLIIGFIGGFGIGKTFKEPQNKKD